MNTIQEIRKAFGQSGDANVEPTAIDKALGIGMSPRSIVRRYAGLSRKAVQRQCDKRHEIQAAFEEARTTHARLAEEYCAGVRERLGRSRKAAFAAPKIAGSDMASELMAYRNALDRVSRITDTRTLSEMFVRAETVGDVPLARAVLYRGYELQSEALLGSYLEQYSHEPNIAVARAWLHVFDTEMTEKRRTALEVKQKLGYDALGVMEKHLEGRQFFVGGRYSVADIALYAYTHVADEGGFDLEDFPAVCVWLERVSSQPGYILITQG
ncbi:MAG TPA: glutathione binding-like protein [Rubrobacter sp.]|nr:glutathione binding-like protein [Rubrobacter sp.]